MEGDDDHYWITATAPALANHPYPRCSGALIGHGKRTLLVADLPMHEKALGGFDEPERCRFLTIDMCQSYRRVARRALPHA